jgi:hypothetical protein
MSMMSNNKGFEPIHLVNAYPWATMGLKVFVDIVGSHGMMSIVLAQNVPSIECIVQELPEVRRVENSFGTERPREVYGA